MDLGRAAKTQMTHIALNMMLHFSAKKRHTVKEAFCKHGDIQVIQVECVSLLYTFEAPACSVHVDIHSFIEYFDTFIVQIYTFIVYIETVLHCITTNGQTHSERMEAAMLLGILFVFILVPSFKNKHHRLNIDLDRFRA